jgi:hypothetical protein
MVKSQGIMMAAGGQVRGGAMLGRVAVGVAVWLVLLVACAVPQTAAFKYGASSLNIGKILWLYKYMLQLQVMKFAYCCSEIRKSSFKNKSQASYIFRIIG